MKNFIDQMAHGIFAERADELAVDPDGRFFIFETQEQAEKVREKLEPTMWPWRVAPIRIVNGGFVRKEK